MATPVSLLLTEWTSATTSPVINAPSSISDGNLLVMVVVTESGANFSTPIAGWTRAANELDILTDSSMAVYYKIASGEGSSWTMTNLFSATEIGGAVVFNFAAADIDGTDPIHMISGNSLSGPQTYMTSPEITPTKDGCTIIQFIGADPGSPAINGTPDSAASEWYDAKDSSNNSYVYAQGFVQSTAATISLTATTLLNDVYGSYIIALNPPASGATEETASVTNYLAIAAGAQAEIEEAVGITAYLGAQASDAGRVVEESVTLGVVRTVSPVGGVIADESVTIGGVFAATAAYDATMYVDGYGGDIFTNYDNLLNGTQPNLGMGAHANFQLDPNQKAIGKYNLSAIPAGSECVSAQFVLVKSYAPEGDSSGAITVFKVTAANEDWVSTATSDPAIEGEACWNQKGYTTDDWAGSAGLETADTDYETPALGSAASNANLSIGTEVAIDLDTDAIAALFGSSFSLVIESNAFVGHYGSADNSTTAYRPRLVVWYIESTGPTEESVSPARYEGIAASDQAEVEDSVTVTKSAGAQAQDNIEAGGAATAAKSAAIQASSGLVIDEAVVLSTFLGIQAEQDNAIEEAVSLGTTLGSSAAGSIIAENSVSISRTEGWTEANQGTIGAAITFSRIDQVLANAGPGETDEGVTLASVHSIQEASNLEASSDVQLDRYDGITAEGTAGEIEEGVALGLLLGASAAYELTASAGCELVVGKSVEQLSGAILQDSVVVDRSLAAALFGGVEVFEAFAIERVEELLASIRPVMSSGNSVFVPFRDKRTFVPFRDKRTFVPFRDKRDDVDPDE